MLTVLLLCCAYIYIASVISLDSALYKMIPRIQTPSCTATAVHLNEEDSLNSRTFAMILPRRQQLYPYHRRRRCKNHHVRSTSTAVSTSVMLSLLACLCLGMFPNTCVGVEAFQLIVLPPSVRPDASMYRLQLHIQRHSLLASDRVSLTSSTSSVSPIQQTKERIKRISLKATVERDATITATTADNAEDYLDSNRANITNSSSSSRNKIDNAGYRIDNISTLIQLLQPYTSSSNSNKNHKYANKEIESAIVRLGQKGRTDQALELYFCVWTLEEFRERYQRLVRDGGGDEEEGVLVQLMEEMGGGDGGNGSSEGGDATTTTTTAAQSNQQVLELQQLQLQKFLYSSKPIRPTTRLMNLAIDACARAPVVRQELAFDIFHSACEGGALSPNVFTFGSLLASCARNGDTATSLELLHELEGGETYLDVVPNGVVYSTVISACERACSLGRRIKKKEGVDGNNNGRKMVDLALELLNNATLALSIDEATLGSEGGKKGGKASSGMGVVGFNAAISTMARAAQWKMAVRLLDEMLYHSSISSSSSDSTNDSSASSSMSTLVHQLESSISSNTLPPLLHVVNNKQYSNKRFLVPKPDEVTFGTVLAACERSEEWGELLRISRAAREYGVELDGIALTSVLHACQRLGLAGEALEYLELMKRLEDDSCSTEFERSDHSFHHTVERRTNGRRRKGAKQALRGPDGVAYRLAISACARATDGHRWQDGIRLLNEMRESAKRTNITANAPDVVAYTAAIAGCSEAGEYTHAMRLIKTMREEGIQPNVFTFSAVITACASASANLARRREEGDRTVELEDVRGPMSRALKLLEAMKSPTSTVTPNIVTYNAAIRACAEGLNLDGAFDLLQQLKEDGLEPSIVTYGSLMTACERVGNIEAASKVFRMVKEDDGEDDSIQANEIIYGAAISCCRKGGQVREVELVCQSFDPRYEVFSLHIFCWNVLMIA